MLPGVNEPLLTELFHTAATSLDLGTLGLGMGGAIGIKGCRKERRWVCHNKIQLSN